MSDLAIQVENLSKRYRIGLREAQHETLAGTAVSWLKSPLNNFRHLRNLGAFNDDEAEDVIWALRDVNFEVKRGEVIGIIGRNGAGKSTLLKILSRITPPTAGRVVLNGRVSSLLEVGTGFHPELTGRENIYLNGTILGMRKAEIDRKFDEIVDFSGVEKFIDTPVKRYSSGMRVRLAFAVAAHLEPEILIIDEVLAVGDTEFQKKCLNKMNEVSRGGQTIILVSHNMRVIANVSERVIWLEEGHIVEDGDVVRIIGDYERLSARSTCRDGTRFVRPENYTTLPRIEWIEILNDMGEPTNVFANGTHINLRVSIVGNLPPSAYFEWVLFTEMGMQATSGGTYMNTQVFPLPPMSGVLHANIGPLNLAQGHYTLEVRLGELPGNIIDAWDNVDTIMIPECIPKHGALNFDSRRGVVYIPAHYQDAKQWHVKQDSN